MKDSVPDFISNGSEIAGGATGAALGFLAGGPAGAAIGGASGSLVTVLGRVISDFSERSLSNRESARVAGSAALAIDQIQSKISCGEQPRDDDFFRLRIGGRPKADELFEAMLLKSKSQYEEYKVRFYANLFVTACFDERLNAAMVSWFMEVLDRLTFSQIETLNEFVVLGSESKWVWGHLNQIAKVDPVVAAHLEQLKSMRLLSLDHWGDTPIEATDIAKTFIKSIQFDSPFETADRHIIRANGSTDI
ncbi:hypothetical protein [Zobellella maritima]|uniref:hypothetical protein n=1 Tax=Zobellella maritima TaxID=2059725 RepID=UPI000E3011B9|nr:hypothetical protein [Zobellella maritima]